MVTVNFDFRSCFICVMPELDYVTVISKLPFSRPEERSQTITIEEALNILEKRVAVTSDNTPKGSN